MQTKLDSGLRPAQVASGPATTGLGAVSAGTATDAAAASRGRVDEDDSACTRRPAGAVCNPSAVGGPGARTRTAGRVEAGLLSAVGRPGDVAAASSAGAARAEAIGDGGDGDGTTASAAVGASVVATAGAPAAGVARFGADAADCGDTAPPGRIPRTTAVPTTATTAKLANTGKARDRGAVAVPADGRGTTGVTGKTGTTGADGDLFAPDFSASSGGSRGSITIVAA